jgi:hypothetical protein
LTFVTTHPHNKKALGIYFGNYDPGFKFYGANRLSFVPSEERRPLAPEIILSLSHKREKDEAAPIKVPADSCRP